MLIAIGTLAGRLGHVVAIIREQWCSAQVYLYAARCVAARKSRGRWTLDVGRGRFDRDVCRWCTQQISPQLEETPKFRNVRPCVTLRAADPVRRACLLSHNAYHYANRRFPAAYTCTPWK